MSKQHHGAPGYSLNWGQIPVVLLVKVTDVLQGESHVGCEEPIQPPCLGAALTHLSFCCPNGKIQDTELWGWPPQGEARSALWTEGFGGLVCFFLEHTMPFADFLLWAFKRSCVPYHHPLQEDKGMSAVGFKMYSGKPQAWEGRFQGWQREEKPW